MEKNHEHEFFTSDEGFEVCIKCGLCTDQQVFVSDMYSIEDISSEKSEYKDILINNHIGYHDEIEQFYSENKSKLVRGYPNIAIFAYSTYCILLENGIYCTPENMERIFHIDNFKKYFCQIEKNDCIQKSNFDLSLEEYSLSAMNNFLSELDLPHLFGRAVRICRNIRKNISHIRIQSLVAVSLYFVLLDSFTNEKNLLEKLSTQFSINGRTLKGVIRKYRCYNVV